MFPLTEIRGYLSTESQLLNLEEWSLFSCRLGVTVAEVDRSGVRVKAFLERFCLQNVGSMNDSNDNEVVTIEVLRRDLHRMITDEARIAGGKGKGSIGGGGKSLVDFTAAFNLFDENGDGSISVDEFRRTLFRLKLVDNLPEAQIPALIALFDTAGKGYINLDDFLTFVVKNKDLSVNPEEDDVIDDDEDDDLKVLSSNTPPIAVTRNADCDWLSWFLWKEACKIEPEDPESVVCELEAACNESEVTYQQGSVSVKDLWNIIFELKLRGSMTKDQFEKSIHYLLYDEEDSKKPSSASTVSGKGVSAGGVPAGVGVGVGVSRDAQVDIEALCRYVVRMGRAYNAMVQEKRNADTKMFQGMLDTLMKEFLDMIAEVDKG